MLVKTLFNIAKGIAKFLLLTNPSIYQSLVKKPGFFIDMHHYFLLYKPYQTLSQFTAVDGKKTLADFAKVPRDVYAVGRLDYDSEGLMILTNDTRLNDQLLNPAHGHKRTYFVQVEGTITDEAAAKLEQGITISVEGKLYRTLPCKANLFLDDPVLPPRHPPIRFRKQLPVSWLSLTLTEGKNRQVRKMTAAVGYPTLRLVRYSIGNLTIDHMQPGNCIAIEKDKLYALLF